MSGFQSSKTEQNIRQQNHVPSFRSLTSSNTGFRCTRSRSWICPPSRGPMSRSKLRFKWRHLYDSSYSGYVLTLLSSLFIPWKFLVTSLTVSSDSLCTWPTCWRNRRQLASVRRSFCQTLFWIWIKWFLKNVFGKRSWQNMRGRYADVTCPLCMYCTSALVKCAEMYKLVRSFRKKLQQCVIWTPWYHLYPIFYTRFREENYLKGFVFKLLWENVVISLLWAKS